MASESAKEIAERLAAHLGILHLQGAEESLQAIEEALRVRDEARDAEWCQALWPANPEGAEPIGPVEGAEHYRFLLREAEERGRTAGVQAEFQSHEAEVLELTRTQEAEVREARRQGREEIIKAIRAASSMRFFDGASEEQRQYVSKWALHLADTLEALPLNGPGEKGEGR